MGVRRVWLKLKSKQWLHERTENEVDLQSYIIRQDITMKLIFTKTFKISSITRNCEEFIFISFQSTKRNPNRANHSNIPLSSSEIVSGRNEIVNRMQHGITK